jgi:hypothetical protein
MEFLSIFLLLDQGVLDLHAYPFWLLYLAQIELMSVVSAALNIILRGNHEIGQKLQVPVNPIRQIAA